MNFREVVSTQSTRTSNYLECGSAKMQRERMHTQVACGRGSNLGDESHRLPG